MKKDLADNETLFIIAIAVAILLVIAFFSVYLFFIFQKRKIRLLKEQQEMKENFEQEMLKTQIEIRDQTMKDVGRELHDNIGQVLTVIKINMNLILGNGIDGKNAERLHTTKELVSEVITDVRLLSKTLNGDLIKQVGLKESISHELNRINKLELIHCYLNVEGTSYTMPSEIEFVVFRILQENLNNILKHARCENVHTTLIYEHNSFTLMQKDDGVGYDLNEVVTRNDAAKSGSGLLNMQRRAELINATLHLNSQPEKGTQLILKIDNVKNNEND